MQTLWHMLSKTAAKQVQAESLCVCHMFFKQCRGRVCVAEYSSLSLKGRVLYGKSCAGH